MVVTLLPYCQVGDDLITDMNTPPLCGKLILQNESFDIPGEIRTFAHSERILTRFK